MANKYCNLDGTKKIKDEYPKINAGFDKVETDLGSIVTGQDLDPNKDVEVLDARGGLPTLGGRLNAIDNNVSNVDVTLNDRINNIIATPTTVSEQEIIDARQGSASLGANITAFKEDYAKFDGVNIFSPNTHIQKTSLLLSAGNIIYNLANGVTDFMEVIPNQYYSLPFNGADMGCLYDSNKIRISGITFVSGTTFKTSLIARYIRLNVNLTNAESITYIDKYMVITGKTYPTQKVEYGAKGFNFLVGEYQIKEKSLTKKHFKEITNIFDKLKLTTGYIDSTGAILASTSLSHSDFIPLETNKTYSIPLLGSVPGGFYDINKVWVAAIPANPFIVPSNIAFMMVNVNIIDPTNVIHKDKYMVINDSIYPNKYVPFNIPFSSYLLDAYIPPKNSKWNGKLIYAFGDSITWYDGNPFGNAHIESGIMAKGYLSYMRDELGATVNNYGISGGTIQSHIATSIKSKSFVTVDVVTINGGANDWATTSSPPPLGTIAPIASAFNIATTYGALQSAVEYILTSNPKIKIYFITPIRGYLKPESTNPLKGQELPESYTNMFKEVGELYGIPVCDLFNQCGFNKLNYSNWYGDIGALGDRYIHLINLGYKRMAEILISFLRDK